MDEILARWRPGEGTAWYLTDHLGTVRDIVNALGQLINHIDYDSFGRILTQTNPAFGDRFTFTGREWDPTLALYYYRARFYDPALGRFVSQDPLGFMADMNLYRYVGNKPLEDIDPSGQMALVEWTVITAAETMANIGCAYAELWAQDLLDDPWAQAETVSKALAFSAMGAVLGSGLAFNILTKAFMLKPIMMAIGTLGGAFQLYALFDDFVVGATKNDWRLFWIRYLCGGVNFLLVPMAYSIANNLARFRLGSQMSIISANSAGGTFRGRLSLLRNKGTRVGAAKLQLRARELWTRTGRNDTVAVIRGRNRITGEEKVFVSKQGSQKSPPRGWQLESGEEWVPGRGLHAEQNIFSTKPNWEFLEGGTSRPACSGICATWIENAGMQLGGRFFSGRQGNPYALFWKR